MTEPTPRPFDPRKRRLLEKLLDDGMVLIQLDARREGVDLPEHLIGHPAVLLNLSRRFGLDVFEIGTDEVQASLSFQGQVHLCRLPWFAIYRMTSHVTGHAYVFPSSVPAELPQFAEDAEDAESMTEPEPDVAREPPRGRPQLRLIKNGD